LYDEILSDARFPEALARLDVELAETTRRRACPVCGGALDASHYRRKTRGGPWSIGDEGLLRLSYCCRRDGCRSRRLPPSVQFLGRRAYLGAVVVLAGVLRQGPTRWRTSRLAAVLGVDRRTLERWRRWWTTALAATRGFEIGRADFMLPPRAEDLPASLLAGFAGPAATRLIAALRWLAERFGSRFPGDDHRSAKDAR